MSKRGRYDLGLSPDGGLASAEGQSPAAKSAGAQYGSPLTEVTAGQTGELPDYEKAIEDFHHDGTRGS